MGKGNRIRRERDAAKRSMRIVRNYDQKNPIEKAMQRRRNMNGAQPRMPSRRPRGVKVIADPTPRQSTPPAFKLRLRKPWRRPKRDNGKRIAKKQMRTGIRRIREWHDAATAR